VKDLARALGMIMRAVVTRVTDSTEAQEVQGQVLRDEVLDLERIQSYGMTAVPQVGAEAVVVFLGGSRSNGVVIAVEDRRYRLTGLAAGEVALYDDQGQKVHLKRDKIVIECKAGGTIELGEGATESFVLGDTFASLYNAHVHPSPAGGSTGTPTVLMGAAHLSAKVKGE